MFYKLDFTETNGEQEYQYNYLIQAKDKKEAWVLARAYIGWWYPASKDWINKYTIEFSGGCVAVHINSLIETTVEEFTKCMVNRYSINYSME